MEGSVRLAKKARTDKGPKKAGREKPGLKDEVSAFAAQLGLATGQPAQGFDDRDFRPRQQKPAGSQGQTPKAASDSAGTDKAAWRPPADQSHQSAAEKSRGLGSRKAQKPGPPQPAYKAASEENKAEQPRRPQASVKPAIEEDVTSKPKLTGKASLLTFDDPLLWYEAAAAPNPFQPKDKASSRAASTQPVDAAQLRADAEAALGNEAAIYEREIGKRSKGDAKWLQQVRRTGTTTDRLAALSLLLREAALPNLKGLDDLLKLAGKRSGYRGIAGEAIDAATEVFTTVLLPDRKLRAWAEHDFTQLPPGKAGQRQALFWMYEDQLKARYAQFVEAVELGSRDNLEFIKSKAIRALGALLAAKPEQEGRLLAALCNKLGDPSRKLASKAGFLLGTMLEEHPAMAPVTVREIERFLFRPGIAPRARYYAVVFLNQLQLSHDEARGGSKLAEKLIDIYFAMFAVLVRQAGTTPDAEPAADGKAPAPKKKARHRDQKPGKAGKGGKGAKAGKAGAKAQQQSEPDPSQLGEVDARMVGAILAGVRRAFPFVASDAAEAVVERHSDALFKASHAAAFGVRVQALALLLQLMTAQSAASDRFYRSLYELLQCEEAASSSKAALMLSLVHKAMAADLRLSRVAAFSKRLLQMALAHQAPFACGCLVLLSNILEVRWVPEAELGFGSRSNNSPSSGVSWHQAPFACGCLVLLYHILEFCRRCKADKQQTCMMAGIVLKSRPGMWNFILEPEEAGDELEHFQDAPDSDADDPAARPAAAAPGGTLEDAEAPRGTPEGAPGGTPKSAGETQGDPAGPGAAGEGAGKPKQPVEEKQGPASYDMRKREPSFAGAQHSAWWELTLLAQHFHPSVGAMARALLSGNPVRYGGNPLRDLALAAFLDKFIQRTPKASTKPVSVMQPHPAGSTAGGTSGAAVRSAAFAALAEQDVPVDTVFFHKYYNMMKSKGDASRKRRRAERDGAEDAQDSDAEDAASGEESDVEDFLADEEDLGDEGGGANPNKPVDYAALGSVEAPGVPAGSGNEASSASSGSLPSVLLDDEASAEEDDVISQPPANRLVKLKPKTSQAPVDPDSASEIDLGSDEGDLSDGEGGSEDINPFDLASGSESEVGAPEDGYADEGLPEDAMDDDSEASGDWVMYKPSDKGKTTQAAEPAGGGLPAKRGKKAKKREAAFASAEDFADVIERNLAAAERDGPGAAPPPAAQGPELADLADRTPAARRKQARAKQRSGTGGSMSGQGPGVQKSGKVKGAKRGKREPRKVKRRPG